jgi:CBS domain-containing protein
MTRKIRDVMAPLPVEMTSIESVASAARLMRDQAIGAVLVLENGQLRGIVTDRDIVVRTVAEGCDPETTRVGDICSEDLVVLSPDDEIAEAARVIREHAVRRVPVVDNGIPMGMVSMGDLALWEGDGSPLAAVVAAPPNA